MKPCSRYAASAVRRLVLAAGITLAALPGAGPSRPAQAQLAVQCVNCSTIWNQLLEYGKQVQQLATQLQSYQTQLQQYANMVTNTLALPQQLWGQVQSDIMQVKNLSNAASLLSGNAGSIVTRLQSASAYANQAASLGNIAGQFTTWQQTIGNSVSTLGKTLGMQQNQQASDAALLASLEQHSQSAQGQMQAIQAGNELAHATAVQLQQIQATLAVTAQMRATEMAVDADRRASQDAAMLHFSTPTPVPTSGYTRY
jgi:P-type conjugative transfer protein TrbJ